MQTFQQAIDILREVIRNKQLDAEKLDEVIAILEDNKVSIKAEDDEAIDKLDEIQDYFQYLMTVKEPFGEDIEEEIKKIIEALQQ